MKKTPADNPSADVSESSKRKPYAAVTFHRPNGSVGTGRVFPPQMNAWITGFDGGFAPSRMTMPRGSRRTVFASSLLAIAPSSTRFTYRPPHLSYKAQFVPNQAKTS